jgi:outer membrane protein assembly factor BamB
MDFGFEGFDSADFDVELEDIEMKRTKKFDRLWEVGYGGTVNNTPAINNGVVYFGAMDGYLYAVDAEKGKEIFKFKCGKGIAECTPQIKGNAVYFGSFDTCFYCVSLKGKEVWRFRTGGEIDVSSIVHKDCVIFCSRDSYAYCLYLDGREKWRFRTGDEIGAVPGAYKNKIFVGSFDGNLYCIDFDTGKEIWRFKTGAEIHNTNPMTMHDGVLYFASFDNYLYAVDISNGKEIWRFRTGQFGNSSSPAIHEGKIYYPSREGIMYCLDIKTGKEIWRFVSDADNSLDQKPLVYEGILYFCGGGNFYALNPQSGHELWRVRTGGTIFSSPVHYKGKLYFGNWDCHLYVIDLETRKVAWSFTTSTMQQSYLQDAFQEFKMEVKKTFSEKEIKEMEKYKGKVGENISLSNYHVTSEYSTTSEYKQKSDYDVNFVMFESILEMEDLPCLLISEDLKPRTLTLN